MLAGFSGSVAQSPCPALAGRHEDGDLIALTRPAVNTQTPQCSPHVLGCESRALSQTQAAPDRPRARHRQRQWARAPPWWEDGVAARTPYHRTAGCAGLRGLAGVMSAVGGLFL